MVNSMNINSLGYVRVKKREGWIVKKKRTIELT